MKFKLTKYLWINLYVCLGISISYYIFFCGLFLNGGFSNTAEALILNAGMLIFGVLPVLGLVIPRWRSFTLIEIQAGGVRSYLFGKLKCEIDTNKEVYYTIFDANLEKLQGCGRKYIVISNEPFVYQDSPTPQFWSLKKQTEFIDYYDMSKQIILPYAENIKHFISSEKWIGCNFQQH